jgi:hypothetical protein
VESKSFRNLFDFFNFIEFCPLCKKRLTETIIFPSSISTLEGKELVIIAGSFESNFDQQPIFTDDPFWKKITINLLDNNISKNYSLYDYPENNSLIVGRQCNKYHFHYNGIANISKSKLILDNIVLDKYHFIRIHGGIHFTVNGSFSKSQTIIRITTPDYHTRELTIPFIDFDLLSKKKIDNKLKNIQLLL